MNYIDEVPIILHELNDSAIHFISRDQYERALSLLQKAQTLIDVGVLLIYLCVEVVIPKEPQRPSHGLSHDAQHGPVLLETGRTGGMRTVSGGKSADSQFPVSVLKNSGPSKKAETTEVRVQDPHAGVCPSFIAAQT